MSWPKRALEIAHTAHLMAPGVLEFLFGPAGQAYGVGAKPKLELLQHLVRNTQTAAASTMFGEHVALARAILSVPRDLPGSVAEFGCFKGMSTASLSLACALTGRRLVVFDSFQGLPAASERIFSFDGNEISYKAGAYAGTLDEVRANVARFGDPSVCEFVPGFFADTLPQRREDERFVVIFEDADLPSSVRDVLRYAWPKLQNGCRFFSHEAPDREVVQLFFDRGWWRDHLDEDAPGIVGSGTGLPLGRHGSGLAYAIRSKPTPDRR